MPDKHPDAVCLLRWSRSRGGVGMFHYYCRVCGRDRWFAMIGEPDIVVCDGEKLVRRSPREIRPAQWPY